MGIRKTIRQWWEHLEDVKRAKKIQDSGQIHLYHFWDIKPMDFWLCSFLMNNNVLTNTQKRLGFWSVFGSRRLIDTISDDINIFFTGENIHIDERISYSDYMLSHPAIDLSLGFDYFVHSKYLRMPLWIIYVFRDCYTYSDICKRCEELRYPKIDNKNKWISAVSSWDPTGIRSTIADILSDIKAIDYAGKWRHNDDTLKNEFADDKVRYLQQYVFNICPENSDSMGYVTEKLFEAIMAGCIPIYWGSYNDPEPGIINKEAILFFNMNDGVDDLRVRFERLVKDDIYRKEFMAQPRLLPGAEDRIWEIMCKFKDRIKQLI